MRVVLILTTILLTWPWNTPPPELIQKLEAEQEWALDQFTDVALARGHPDLLDAHIEELELMLDLLMTWGMIAEKPPAECFRAAVQLYAEASHLKCSIAEEEAHEREDRFEMVFTVEVEGRREDVDDFIGKVRCFPAGLSNWGTPVVAGSKQTFRVNLWSFPPGEVAEPRPCRIPEIPKMYAEDPEVRRLLLNLDGYCATLEQETELRRRLAEVAQEERLFETVRSAYEREGCSQDNYPPDLDLRDLPSSLTPSGPD